MVLDVDIVKRVERTGSDVNSRERSSLECCGDVCKERKADIRDIKDWTIGMRIRKRTEKKLLKGTTRMYIDTCTEGRTGKEERK